MLLAISTWKNFLAEYSQKKPKPSFFKPEGNERPEPPGITLTFGFVCTAQSWTSGGRAEVSKSEDCADTSLHRVRGAQRTQNTGLSPAPCLCLLHGTIFLALLSSDASAGALSANMEVRLDWVSTRHAQQEELAGSVPRPLAT